MGGYEGALTLDCRVGEVSGKEVEVDGPVVPTPAFVRPLSGTRGGSESKGYLRWTPEE